MRGLVTFALGILLSAFVILAVEGARLERELKQMGDSIVLPHHRMRFQHW